MNIENAIAWFLVGLSSGIAMVGLAVIVAVLILRFTESSKDAVLRDALKGGRR